MGIIKRQGKSQEFTVASSSAKMPFRANALRGGISTEQSPSAGLPIPPVLHCRRFSSEQATETAHQHDLARD